MSMPLDDRVVVITGGAGGLGQSVTRACLSAGAKVVVAYRGQLEPSGLTTRLGADNAEQLQWIAADLTDEASVTALAENTLARYGRVDGWLNLVGGYAGGVAVADLALADFEAMFTLNVRTAFLGSRAALRAMLPRRQGSIVNVSSLGALRGTAGHAGYAPSKAAVIRLTETLAAEGASAGIRANVVLPGLIDTPANRAAMPDADRSTWVSPDAIAAVLVFLLSDAARGISGASLPVGG
ncbi:SDR family oxidoreductase [Chloracidobacterium validum]|uniref:SDR family oxidoreductase n=1 Tax=Chloracidobacterium validum TaxID=2821543 RepID=A0ABX8BF34_9BACT|nr:SDR family NAD(P)-dependent oxidoreductase [Chloracidobacterium validum]QUW04525.1 SDR family oxidoreductase [Chloracidobacterium validum]